MELKLSTEEKELLLAILEQRHREMLLEIAHTHHREFKEGLRNNERTLDSILGRLREAPVQEVHV